ncbi:MAG: non-canonical purine NTP pyrophosphatase [Actinobacteria bacterium]|nr:non-canonical purine NTP pyrophosphatase [Actinomycetota bacterium]
MQALLCSQNSSKLREFRAALPGWELELLDAGDYPPEDGATYVENARGKAEHGRSVEPEAWLLADDSGIEVAALGGAPGIATARWAADGVTHLLELLDGVADRRARYVCELVALAPEGRELRGTGVLDGTIATARSGAGGFGYDPVFVPAGETATVAELGDEWKAVNSHRALAARALLAVS